MSSECKEVGDIIRKKDGGPEFRIIAVTRGSWTGEKYYECHAVLDDFLVKKVHFIYEDESVLVRKCK